MWDWYLTLDPRLAAALVASVVSVLTTFVTVLFTPVGSYLIAKRELRDRLKTEYEYEQRKKLRNLIGRHHGRVLQAAEDMNYRTWNLYTNEDKGWLDVSDDYREVGADPDNYYFQTTVFRFLALMSVVRRFEAEAVYVDSRIAESTDFRFLKYLRAIFWVVTDTALFQGLPYDPYHFKDHFFRDDLRRACDSLLIREENSEERSFPSLDEVREKMGAEGTLDSTLGFFKGLCSDEKRYRWDRVVALHLLLLAFINDFGHEFQRSTGEQMEQVADEFETDEVPRNLLTWLSRLGLAKEGNAMKVGGVLRAKMNK